MACALLYFAYEYHLYARFALLYSTLLYRGGARSGQVKRLNITVEILVNAAGMCRVGRVESLQDDDLMAQLQLNIVGTTVLTRRFIKGTR